MTCEEIRERMLDVAAGLSEAAPEEKNHLASCNACAGKLEDIRQSMALLDEWHAPEPSPYFDVRLQARLREEMAKSQTGWLQWFRRPVLAAALTVLMGVGVGSYFARSGRMYHAGGNDRVVQQLQPGTAVSDLQALDKNHELYSDFELLDELSVQNDVTATP
jgi:anti-sigma factor RsiW